MALAYTAPGISVQELSSPSVSPALGTQDTVCLVGLTRGYEVRSVQIVVGPNATAGTFTVPAGGTLSAIDGSNRFQSILNAIDPTQGSGANGSGYVEGTDFTTTLTGSVVTVTPITTSGSAFYNVTGTTTLNIAYRWLATNYYVATRHDSLASIEAQYGPAYNTSGTAIQTTTSYAASLAFENGAQTVVVQPLFKLSSGNPVQPTLAEAASSTQWAATLVALRDLEDVNILVPVIGQSDSNVGDSSLHGVHQAVQDHQKWMSDNGQYIIAVFGEDSASSSSNAAKATLITHANDLSQRYGGVLAQSGVFVSPSRFTRNLANSSTSVTIGGQYAAAGIAGMIASRAVTSPLTRKIVSGLATVADPRTRAEKDTDAANGMLVIENKGSLVQVRHAVTLDNLSVANRELSVVRAKQLMIESVRSTLDNALPIVADGNALTIVKSLVIGVLDQLRNANAIVSYNGVQARILNSDPTSAEVRFSYQPAFPLNYVSIVFSLDLSGNGSTNVVSTS